VEPVRVKVYGLFRWTRPRYIRQSVFDFALCAAVLLIWFLAWPGLRNALTKHNLPPEVLAEIAIGDQTPLILLAGAVGKVCEMWIILRRFAQKEAEQLAKATKTSP
jgi:hypothetical protein